MPLGPETSSTAEQQDQQWRAQEQAQLLATQVDWNSPAFVDALWEASQDAISPCDLMPGGSVFKEWRDVLETTKPAIQRIASVLQTTVVGICKNFMGSV